MREITIVLLPGLDGTGTLFRPLLAHLPKWMRPVVVAYPGSERLGYTDLLPLVLQSLPTTEPFIILGESFSGPLALMAAASGPPGLQGVVLCVTFVRNPLWFRAPWLRYLVADFPFRLYRHFSGAKAMLGGYSTHELRKSFQAAIAAVTPAVFANRIREVIQVDVSDALKRCPVPVLDLRGAWDMVVPRHNAREVIALAPQTLQVTINAPHMLLQTRPEEATTAIRQFVETLAC